MKKKKKQQRERKQLRSSVPHTRMLLIFGLMIGQKSTKPKLPTTDGEKSTTSFGEFTFTFENFQRTVSYTTHKYFKQMLLWFCNDKKTEQPKKTTIERRNVVQKGYTCMNRNEK